MKNMVRHNIRKFKFGRIAKRGKIVRARGLAKLKKSVMGCGKHIGYRDLSELLGYYTQCNATYKRYQETRTRNAVTGKKCCKQSTVENQPMSSNSIEEVANKTSLTTSLESLNRSSESSENYHQFETSASNITDTSFSPEDITKVSADNVNEKVEIIQKLANILPPSPEAWNIPKHIPLDAKSVLKPTTSINLHSLDCASSLNTASANVLTSSTASAPSLKCSNKSIVSMNPPVKALVHVGVEQLAGSSSIPKEMTIKRKSVENNPMNSKDQALIDSCTKQNPSPSVSIKSHSQPNAEGQNEEQNKRYNCPKDSDNEFPKLSKTSTSAVAQINRNTIVSITPSSTLLKFKINVSPTAQNNENQENGMAGVENQNEGYEILLDIDLAQILELYKINKL